MKCTLIFLVIASFSSFAKSEGRFQLIRINEFPNSLHMIDTATGKIWRMTCFTEIKDGDCAIKAWSPQKIIGVNTTEKEVWGMAEAHEKSVKKEE